MNLVKKHTLLILYSFVFFGLMYGVYVTSGTKYMGYLLLFFGSLFGFYFIFRIKAVQKFLSKISLDFFKGKLSINGWVIVSFVFVSVITHYFILKGIPVLIATKMNYIEDVALVRTLISSDTPSLMAYVSAILLKALIPFFLLYFFIRDKKLFYWLLFFVGVFYGFSLMQKSYIVSILMPVLIYSLVSKKLLFAIKYIVFILIFIFSLSKISNPPGGSNGKIVNDEISLSELEERIELAELSDSIIAPAAPVKSSNLVAGIINRVLVVPGYVVSKWFEAIPAVVPFLNGDGYRVVAKLKGKKHVDYSSLLYPIIKPQNAKQGLTGTVNVASFMYDYSNFGLVGLILSGFILALGFVFIEIIFKDHFFIKLSLNAMPLLMLSSGALTTLLFSGGWAFLILFFILFLKD